MGAISTIRKHYGIVVALIGVAIAAFIIGDILSPEGGGSVLHAPDDTVGKIGDREITYNHFEQRYRRAQEIYVSRTGDTHIAPGRQAQIQNQVWEDIINETILDDEITNLNLTYTDAEFVDMINPDNPHAIVRQLLADETGQFDGDQLRQFLSFAGQDRQARSQLIQIERAVEQQQLQNKYFNLIEKGMFVTDMEARNHFFNENQTADVEFMGIRVSDIPDEAIEVSNRDLRNYYNNNKSDFKREESRTLRFVTFEVIPSEEDSQQYFSWVNDQIERFRQASNDTAFVELNSDRDLVPDERTIMEIDRSAQDDITKADTGDVVGPYVYDDAYNITKVIEIREADERFYRARNIFIEGAPDDVEALQLTRDLLQRIREGESFAELAREHSMDEAAFDGGDLGWQREGSMPAAFEDAVWNASPGELSIVESDAGFYVLELMQPVISETYVTATVSRNILPSSKTYERFFDIAFDFRRNVNDPESFEALADESGLRVRESANLKRNDQFVTGIGYARSFIKWSFENKRHAISDVFELQDEYVLGYISEAKRAGHYDLDEVREEVESAVLKERKKDEIERLIKEELERETSLTAVANALDVNIVNEVDLYFVSQTVRRFGREPALIGAVFGLQEGSLSPIVRGNEAVFLAQTTRLSEVNLPEDISPQRNEIKNNRRNFAVNNAYDKLKDLVPVEDHRYRFY